MEGPGNCRRGRCFANTVASLDSNPILSVAIGPAEGNRRCIRRHGQLQLDEHRKPLSPGREQRHLQPSTVRGKEVWQRTPAAARFLMKFLLAFLPFSNRVVNCMFWAA